MAKKAADAEPAPVLSVHEDILKQIRADFGDNIAVTGEDFLKKEDEKKVISVGPAIDIGIGGGVPEGSWVIMAGLAKGGKTMTALSLAANAQRAGMHVYLMNVEGRLKRMNIDGTNGLDTSTDKLTIIESTEDKILSAQDYLSIGEKILLNHKKCMVIFDSFSALCHEKELLEGIGTSTRGGQGVLLAQFCGQMGNVVPVKKSIVVGMVHIMANTSGFGSNKFEKGGNAIKYQVDVKLRIKTAEPWNVGTKENAKIVGKQVTWVCETNALGAIPGQEVISYLRYGYGVDDIYELIQTAIDIHLITKSASWLKCSFMENHLDVLGITEYDEKLVQAQGGEKLYELLRQNPKWLEILKQEVGKVLN